MRMSMMSTYDDEDNECDLHEKVTRTIRYDRISF